MNNKGKYIKQIFRDADRSGSREYSIKDKNVIIHLAPQVFPPMPITIELAKQLPDLTGKTVADIGTGSGFLAIAAALAGAKEVIATDLNPKAVSLATDNFAQNGLTEKCRAVVADFLPDTPTCFAVIVSNPPCMPIIPASLAKVIPSSMKLAVDAGLNGDGLTLRLIRVASERLLTGGKLIFPLPHWSNVDEVRKLALRLGFKMQRLSTIEVPYWLPYIWQNGSKSKSSYNVSDNSFQVDIITASYLE